MFRRINPQTEKYLFAQAWLWAADYPGWFQQIDAIDRPSFEGWHEIACKPTTLTWGIWKEDRLRALIQFTESEPGYFEAHFDSDGSLERDELADAIFSAGWEIFLAGAQMIFAWVAKQHRACQQICNSCQLFWDGARQLRGQLKGKPVEWLRLTLPRDRWERMRDEQTKASNDINEYMGQVDA